MRIGVRQIANWLAIYAIALHAVLWTPASLNISTNVDPFSVICHSDGQTTASDQQPAAPVSPKNHACDHCNLCSSTPAPSGDEKTIVSPLLPALVLQVLRPTQPPTRDGATHSPHKARAPPSLAG